MDLTFRPHCNNLLRKLMLKLWSFFCHKSCFPFHAHRQLVLATFLALKDHSDIVSMNVPVSSLHPLETVHHGALRFITGRKPLTRHYTLYSLVKCPSLHTCRLFIGTHWFTNLFCLVPSYLSGY